MKYAGSQPARCLMVGDSPADIEAARRAGTPAVAFANKPGKARHLELFHPTAMVTALAQLTEYAAR